MKIHYYLFIAVLAVLPVLSCGQTQDKKEANENSSKYKFTNRLIHESSPYLLQHAHNPVDWYPWGEEAFEKAKKENKLVIISIGYAACHWCHVMEHESYEDEEVAKFMNDNFVCIKVDREERPDVDKIYMNAVQLISGSGGWPLNCITLPDGRPIFGGTYFPKAQWLDMLKQVLDFSKQHPDKTEQQATALSKGIQSTEIVVANPQKPDFSEKDLKSIFATWKNSIDYKEGGMKKAPKFPMPVGYQFLLHYYYITQDKDALRAVTTTLDKMANGGIYDQVGGGFARYSTDAHWKVPHFEKMLYDNAQLVSLYASAYQLTKNPYYKSIVEETLDCVQRDFTSKEGGFYSSLDADSAGEEGKFYVWTQNELQQILGDQSDIISDYYHVTKQGNWERSQNILFKSGDDKTFATKHKISESQLEELVSKSKKALLKERIKRVPPRLDDKIITSWNALMIKAYINAYEVFDDKKYLNIALKSAELINTKVKMPDGRLHRIYKLEKASVNGFLDDYAFTIEAFIAIYQATFDEEWLKTAKQLADYTIAHFYDKENGMFYYTSDTDPSLIARKMEISDNVIPSSNSEMAKNLFVLGNYFYSDKYIDMAKKMLNNVKKNAVSSGPYFGNWDILMSWFVSPPYEVAILGNNFKAKLKEFNQSYLPNVFLSGGKNEGKLSLLENKLVKGKTTIYVCQNKTCQKPVNEVKEALSQIHAKPSKK